MTLSEAAERTLKDGDPHAALARLQEDIRARPSDAKLRVFLFQLLCVVGQWDRALNQLKVASELEPLALPMAQMYGDAVRCEAIRDEVFDGKKSPMVLGEPDQWLALLIESRLLAGRGEASHSEEFRARAFEEAPTSNGTIDGRPFDWVADADSRLGPVVEAIINGRYYWVPFSRVPRDDDGRAGRPPRSGVDAGAAAVQNGGESLALIRRGIPAPRAPDDGAIALARKTSWESIGEDAYRGLGQRIITTDTGETPFLEIRALSITQDGDPVPDAAGPDHA
jgi:type VI secretion system protein ImpE